MKKERCALALDQNLVCLVIDTQVRTVRCEVLRAL
jgi:hypothetical protein